MAYSNQYYSSGYYKNLWPRPYIEYGKVVVDDIRHLEGNAWKSIKPGDTDNSGKLLLSGFAYSYATIEIYDNGKLIFTTQAGRLGTWGADLSSVLTTGEHNFMIKQAGQSFAPGAPITITIAGNGADIAVEINHVYDDAGEIAGVLHQGNHTDDSRPTFSGKGPANSQVTIVDENNGVIGYGRSDAFGNWSVTPEFPIADGEYNFRAFIAGRFSSDFNLTIDTEVPATPLEFTGAFDYLTYGSIADNGETRDLRPNFSGKAAPGETVYLYVEGSNEPIGGSVANGFGTWSIDLLQDLPLGTQTLLVRAGDQTATFTLTVAANNAFEPVTIDALVDGDTYGLVHEFGQIKDTTPWINGTSEPFANVVIFDGSTILGTATAGYNGKWSIGVNSELAAGQHSVTAIANGQLSDSFTFTVEAPQPTSGWGWGRSWSSFSVNEAVEDTSVITSGKTFAAFGVAELLEAPQAALFAVEAPQTADVALNITDAQFAQTSDFSGVAVDVAPAATIAWEENTYA